MTTLDAACQILVSGEVQGVGYRYWTRGMAAGLGVTGWARNLADGRVEIHAEGDPAALEALVEACRKGPRSAVVTAVVRSPRRPRGATRFEIRRDGAAPEPAEDPTAP